MKATKRVRKNARTIHLGPESDLFALERQDEGLILAGLRLLAAGACHAQLAPEDRERVKALQKVFKEEMP